MRMMVRFHFSTSSGNGDIRSGKIPKVFEQLTADLKPEAAYLYPEQGERGGILVFDMQDPSWVAGVVERFSFGLQAKVELFPIDYEELKEEIRVGYTLGRQCVAGDPAGPSGPT